MACSVNLDLVKLELNFTIYNPKAVSKTFVEVSAARGTKEHVGRPIATYQETADVTVPKIPRNSHYHACTIRQAPFNLPRLLPYFNLRSPRSFITKTRKKRRSSFSPTSEQIQNLYGMISKMRARNVVKRLQREVLYLLRGIANRRTNHIAREPAAEERGHVKDGCFSVVTIDGDGKPKKFSVALKYLAHPSFVKLLEAAEVEFGFSQQGVLVIPGEAGVLENILSS